MKKVVLNIQNLNQSYEKQQRVIKALSLLIYEGSIVSLVGESGSGKTTLARLIAGLEVPDSGTIELNGEMVFGDDRFTPPEERGVGMVFQSYALFPHLSVEKNIAYGISKKENRIYAIRMNELQTTTRCSYHTKAQVVKSSFLGTHYLNIGILPNKTKINFMTSEAVSGEFTLGFDSSSIFEFQKNPLN